MLKSNCARGDNNSNISVRMVVVIAVRIEMSIGNKTVLKVMMVLTVIVMLILCNFTNDTISNISIASLQSVPRSAVVVVIKIAVSKSLDIHGYK